MIFCCNFVFYLILNLVFSNELGDKITRIVLKVLGFIYIIAKFRIVTTVSLFPSIDFRYLHGIYLSFMA